jgi:murein DD-endopeptidase MepM/ murein hydrolase activator NlpD
MTRFDHRRVSYALAVAMAIFPALAAAISNSEYNELRNWTLGSKGSLSARWGDVNCSVWGQIYRADCKHPGVDYGTLGKAIDIKSVGGGVVTGTGNGKVCIYNSKRNKTLCYLHLSSIKVSNGKPVGKGDVIGKTGNTACPGCAVHLHFEARNGNKSSAASKYSDSTNPYDAAKSMR